jgi:hypothetical protein
MEAIRSRTLLTVAACEHWFINEHSANKDEDRHVTGAKTLPLDVPENEVVYSIRDRVATKAQDHVEGVSHFLEKRQADFHELG